MVIKPLWACLCNKLQIPVITYDTQTMPAVQPFPLFTNTVNRKHTAATKYSAYLHVVTSEHVVVGNCHKGFDAYCGQSVRVRNRRDLQE